MSASLAEMLVKLKGTPSVEQEANQSNQTLRPPLEVIYSNNQ